MAIHLVTGTPGAGKTLRTVYEVLRPAVGSVIRNGDKEVTRRLMVGGIPALLIEHEPISVVDTSVEKGYVDKWSGTVRLPGDAPHDVEHRADNWWLWCMPGDLICVDEAWQVFGAFPAGRKMPDFLSKLAVHRHYGVDFILIGQAPTQFHTHARGLVDKHEFVRRMFASSRTVVYEWDHCSSHDRTSKATKSTWGHAKQAFGLYRSSQLHIKHKARIPLTLWLLLIAIPTIGVTWSLVIKKRLSPAAVHSPAALAASASAAIAAPAAAPPAASQPLGHFVAAVGEPGFTSAVVARRTWPEPVAGCWTEGDVCRCVTQEAPPRVIVDRAAMCLAVVAGDLVPPQSHPRPERAEPVAVDRPPAAASGPSA